MKQFPTHIVAVFGVVANDRNEILLLKSRNRNVWMFPGGQVENGEDLIEALVREAEEESGMQIEVNRLFSVSSNLCTYPGYNGYGMVPTKVIMGFTCTYKGGEFRESDETTAFLWVSPDHLLDYLTVPDSAAKAQAYLSFQGDVEYSAYRHKPEYEVKRKRSI